MKLTCVPSTPETIRPSLDKVNVWTVAAGLERMAGVIEGAAAFRVLDEEGEEIGVYALKVNQLEGGAVAWLVAGQGRAEIDLTQDLLPHIEKQVHDVDFFAIQTTRPGLIKKLAEQGYTLGGAIMVKKLK